MFNSINMEFVQALNPLYAVPIVAVIICAFIVYAFGFKSPVQPPSFDGIEEDKKYSKKRKGKDTQKSKLLQNGKLNGNAVGKNVAVPSGKKKDTSEKHSPTGKAVTPEKSSVVEKKASKKSRAQNEKKTVVEKKKESISNDDMNDGEWVQLVSKKGRKNRKKDEVLPAEKQPDTSKSSKMTDVNKSDESNAEELPKKSEAIAMDSVAVDQKQDSELENEKNVQSNADLISSSEEPMIPDVATEAIHLEKQLPKESIAKESKALEEGNKTKKKEKEECGKHSFRKGSCN